MDYKVAYCRDCRKYQVLISKKRIKCKFCNRSSKLYKKRIGSKPSTVVLVHETSLSEVAQGLVSDLTEQKTEYSTSLFSSYNLRRDN